MYICICQSVSEHRIQSAVAEGACTLEHLQERLGVATGCGRCAGAALECLRKAREGFSQPLPQPGPV